MRKLFSIILSLLPLYAIAYDVEIDGIYYNLNTEEKTAAVTSGDSKYSGMIDIPSSIIHEEVEYSVTSITEKAFYNCSSLVSVSAPSTVTEIGESTYANSSGLTFVSLPSVNIIPKNAFSSCQGLMIVEIPSAKIIGESAFYSCTSLATLPLTDMVEEIERSAFQNCNGVISLTIPRNINTVENNAFYGCNNIEDLYFDAKKLTWVDPYSFDPHIKNIHIGNEVVYLPSYFLYENLSVTEIRIPNNVKYIGGSAFANCSSLTEITIPEPIVSIGSYAFDNCKKVKKIYFNATHCVQCGDSNPAFRLTSSIGDREIVIGPSVEIIPTHAFDHSYATKIYLDKSVKTIGAYAFQFSKMTDFYCGSITPPVAGATAFAISEIEKATLHVPSEALEKYQTTSPWKNFGIIVAGVVNDPEAEKCTTPSIAYKDGKLTFSCSTANATYHYSITASQTNESTQNSDSGIVVLTPKYTVSVYATAEGMRQSETASSEISLESIGDVNGDGEITVEDVTDLVNKVLNNE